MTNLELPAEAFRSAPVADVIAALFAADTAPDLSRVHRVDLERLSRDALSLIASNDAQAAEIEDRRSADEREIERLDAETLRAAGLVDYLGSLLARPEVGGAA